MHFDHIAEERQDRNFAIWLHLLLKEEPEKLAMGLVQKHRPGKVRAARLWKNGAFNVCYQVRCEDGFEAIVRFTALGRVIFRSEKVQSEVAVMNYLRLHTSIPVPEVLGSGICGPGPYIVMSFVEGVQLSKILQDPHAQGRPVLNPKISDRALSLAFREMANIVLELSKPEFPRVGSLRQDGKHFTVTARPFTFNMNELATSANLPPEEFFTGPFESAADYFDALAVQHLSHLRNQRNDAVRDEEDCKKKYTARCLFRRLVQNLFRDSSEPFRLYCDDFRPSNVLIDTEKLCISAAIDWEFTYVAPAEFTYVAPWWLLLQSPEDWESDLNQLLARYLPRLHLFLRMLRECENAQAHMETISESQRLSTRMKNSLENGMFWVCLASRSSSMFDEIYWTFIDPRHFGPFTSIEERVGILTEEERRPLDGLVCSKMEQARERQLDEYYTPDKLVDL